jgi:hypothetical protein
VCRNSAVTDDATPAACIILALTPPVRRSARCDDPWF